MRRVFVNLIFTYVFLFLSQIINAQDVGKYSVVNFHHRAYRGHSQSWAIAQDKRGLIYVANNVGIIEYDGSDWRHISVNNALPRCLDVDSNGRIWVGAQDEFGYLAADSSHSLSYVSLCGSLPESYKPFGLIRKVFATPRGVYFSSNSLIVRVAGNGEYKVWTPKTSFHRTYMVDGCLFVSQRDIGLSFMNNDSLTFIPGTEVFGSELIYTILPFNDRYFLVGTQSNGFYLLARDAIVPRAGKAVEPILKFQTSDDAFFRENWIYTGLSVDDGVFAIGTYRGGVVFIDLQGRFIRKIDATVSLQDDAVWHLFKDNQDNLWMALNNGISYTPIHSQLTEWSNEAGLNGVLQSVVRFKNDIYVSSNAGVFRKVDGRFYPVEGVDDLSWKLKVVKQGASEHLLAATSSGIYRIDGDRALPIENGGIHAYCLTQSVVFPNILYAGVRNGVAVIRYSEGQYKLIGKLDADIGEVYTVIEDSNGDIWCSDRYRGVRYVDIINPYQLVYEESQLYSLPNSPKYDDMSVVLIDGVVKASSEGGLSMFDAVKNQFVPDSSLGVEFATGETGLRVFCQDNKGDIWFEAYQFDPNRWLEKAVKYPGGIYRREPAQFRTIPETIFFDVYPDSRNVTWIAATDGLFRYDASVGAKNNHLIRVHIRQVTANRTSRIYNGAICGPLVAGELLDDHPPVSVEPEELSHSMNSLSFLYSAPFFGQQQELMYSYYLEGYDEGWSEWSHAQSKEYTNLPFGNYVFRVKAKNLFEVESPVASYSFRIKKPVYLQWYFLVLYSLLLTLVVWFVVYLNTRLLRASNIKLQRLVDERTLELVSSKQVLLEKNFELQHQKEEILSQRDEMHEQNKHINASIQYATTIQQAILPDLSVSFDGLFKHFLIYLPKELVSGDFYWVSQTGPRGRKSEKVFVAVVDCTGHGVPGAFMSLIGSRLLNEIVNERKVHNPAAILTELSDSINLALRQDVSESFDGMDVALCMIERKLDDMCVVTYAGANRPLFYLNKGDDRIQTLKGNRKSIGSVLPDVDTEFTNCKITMYPGDMLFMCTDGFTDQNNAFKRKFTTCRFHTYLLANIDKPMTEIAGALIREFDEFKGDEHQRDDITVLGIKL
ncbi:MAG: SpoIIE family protein phosphatase [Bacteroidales bacterium]|nr:SpoIIE family protein phosphatase [Bacteroidales bacterium]